MSDTPPAATPGFGTAFLFWLKLGFVSFGGPAGQIAILHNELVERRRWIAEGPFLHALNFCMLLPGPEAQQLVTYVGWRLHGLRGALVAGWLFVLPGAAVMLVLAWIAAAHGDWPPVAAVFSGIKPVVIAIIVHALWRIGRRALTGPASVALAVLAFVGIFFAGLPFPAIVGAAALVGLLSSRLAANPFAGKAVAPDARGAPGPAPRPGRLVALVASFVVLWLVPVALVIGLLGSEPFADVAALFSKAAFVTFGGAYAVLPYIADAAVGTYGWLDPAQMTNGLALAESTPGPLIMVTQYVGFFAGWTVGPWQAVVAAALTTWVTFLPCFLFILAGAPHVERLYDNALARSALGAITAAVVGVIANLGVFLGLAVLFDAGGRPDAIAIVLALAAAGLLFRTGLAVHWLVLLGAGAGLLLHAAGLV